MTSAPQVTRWILLVDDEPLLLRGMARELADDYHVLAARSFQEAISVLEGQHAIRAVVSDFSLGAGPSGIDLLVEVQRQAPACARLLVSGWVGVQELAMAIQHGIVQRFVAKPWRPGDLLDAVRAVVGPPP